MADLETRRLRMVSWSAELAWAALNDKTRLGDMLAVQVPQDFPNQSVKKHFLPSLLKAFEQDPSVGKWSGMIVHASDGVVIGSMGFKSPPDDHGNIEIGYDVIPEYQGHGYATEMAAAFIGWAFEQPGVRRITANCLVSNTPSRRVLQKIGMRQTGVSNDLIHWELLKPDH